jgi:hypothetical protein
MRKIIILLTILFTFIACNEKKEGENNKWSEKAKKDMLNSCIGNEPIPGLTKKETEDYCNCILNKTIEAYPDPSVVKGDLHDDFVNKVGAECIQELGIKTK